MRYHIDYVGYQGVFLDDEQNVRATLDFVTGFTTVHLGGGDIQLPPPDCELQMGLLDIVGHKSERKAFDLDVPARPHPDKALRHFFDWYDEAKTLLQDAYVVGDLWSARRMINTSSECGAPGSSTSLYLGALR